MNNLLVAENNQLIPLKENEDGEILVSGRELHEFLEVKTPYTQWFDRMKEYGFSESVDFIGLSQKSEKPQGGRPTEDHIVKLDMAKEIAMIQRNEKGKQARQYFISVEKAWNSPEMIMKRALEIANKKVLRLQKENEVMQPKAEFYDDVAGSKDAIEMAHVAKVLDMPRVGRNKLFDFLREEKILDSNNIPYQAYIDRGYFRTVEQKFNTSKGEVKINIKTLVYQKGIDYIRKKIKEKM